MNPIEHFIKIHGTSPAITEALAHLDNPLDADGIPRVLNRTTLAELAGVTYPVVHRTELALFEKIPPKLLAFMQKYGKSYDDYPGTYKRHRATIEAQHILQEKGHSRRDVKHWLNEDIESINVRIPILTFKDWRSRHFGSVMQMAKVLLINPTIIANYENGQTRSLPVGVARQFRRFGMEQGLINQIAKLECPKPTEGTDTDETA